MKENIKQVISVMRCIIGTFFREIYASLGIRINYPEQNLQLRFER